MLHPYRFQEHAPTVSSHSFVPTISILLQLPASGSGSTNPFNTCVCRDVFGTSHEQNLIQ
ncbi:MAG: hypothetical protein WBP33_02810 [Saprospiraceae bacterium]|nr:hypothetical protein [Candidatus Vicinibacter proximus]MCC6841915.1 hypothetical protein [Saprospiraceae bacterium]